MKVPQILLGLILFFYILYLGQDILIPLTFALIISILLNPLVNFINRRGVGRVLSITISVLLFLVVVGGIIFFIGSQVARFREAMPELTKKSELLTDDLLDWACEKFDLNRDNVDNWIRAKKNDGLKDISGILGNTIITISGIAIMVLLIPIYIFLFLFYKPLLLEFIGKVFTSDKHGTLAEILVNTRTMVQSYLIGLLIEMVIITTLNTTVLLLVGVPYAIVIGSVGALLNLIPYIGGLVSITIAMFMAMLTGTPVDTLYVMGGYLAIQLLDNNFIVPVIVASKVKVNALVSIIVVLFWGALWGIAGMFLSIPITAMIKVIFDKVKPLKPYGLLLGDSMPPIGKKIFRLPSLHRHAPVPESSPQQE
jgi:predicted PurR-regulated permease PerM